MAGLTTLVIILLLLFADSLPNRAIWEFIVNQCLGFHLDALTRVLRNQISSVFDDTRMHKMLVQVIHKFANTVV